VKEGVTLGVLEKVTVGELVATPVEVGVAVAPDMTVLVAVKLLVGVGAGGVTGLFFPWQPKISKPTPVTIENIPKYLVFMLAPPEENLNWVALSLGNERRVIPF
jgi:hypothetical protein